MYKHNKGLSCPKLKKLIRLKATGTAAHPELRFEAGIAAKSSSGTLQTGVILLCLSFISLLIFSAPAILPTLLSLKGGKAL